MSKLTFMPKMALLSVLVFQKCLSLAILGNFSDFLWILTLKFKIWGGTLFYFSKYVKTNLHAKNGAFNQNPTIFAHTALAMRPSGLTSSSRMRPSGNLAMTSSRGVSCHSRSWRGWLLLQFRGRHPPLLLQLLLALISWVPLGLSHLPRGPPLLKRRPCPPSDLGNSFSLLLAFLLLDLTPCLRMKRPGEPMPDVSDGLRTGPLPGLSCNRFLSRSNSSMIGHGGFLPMTSHRWSLRRSRVIVLVRRDLHAGDPHSTLGRIHQEITAMISPVLVVVTALVVILHGLSGGPLHLLDPEENAADPLWP